MRPLDLSYLRQEVVSHPLQLLVVGHLRRLLGLVEEGIGLGSLRLYAGVELAPQGLQRADGLVVLGLLLVDHALELAELERQTLLKVALVGLLVFDLVARVHGQVADFIDPFLEEYVISI